MEWSKTTISKTELEKKQKEFMEQAMKMAQKAGLSAEEKPAKEPSVTEEIAEAVYEEVTEETAAEPEEAATRLEEALSEAVEELSEEAAEEIMEEPKEKQDFFEEPAPDVAEEERTFGVFDAEELSRAIESGEISGEGLKQAAEILEEMKNKTDMMKRLIAEQEGEEKARNCGDFGLNGYIDRHNTNCRGCSHGKHNTP